LLVKTLVCVALAVFTLPHAAFGAGAAPTVIVVYPLIVSAKAPAELGLAVSNILSTGIAQGGDVTIADPGGPVDQTDYLSTARKLGAAYYVSGYVSTIGNQVAAVEQLVSSKSGVMVWRTSSTYAAPADARATGAVMHDIIVQFASQGFAAFNNGIGTAPAAAPAPAAPARDKPVPLASPLRIPGNVNVAAAPLSATTPAPIAVTGYSVVVGPFDGNADLSMRLYAASAAVQLLPRYNMSGAQLEDAPATGATSYGLLMCAQQGSDYYLTGQIDVQKDDPGRGFTFTVLLRMQAYDCNNRSARPLEFVQSTTSVSIATAIDNAFSGALPDLEATKRGARR
jgi:hypothetical protein